MRDTITRWIRWEPHGLGPYETVRARLMSRVLVSLVVVVSVLVPVSLLLHPRWAAILPAIFVAIYLLSLRLLWSGRPQAAAGLVLGVSFVLMGVLVVPLGGVDGTAPIYLLLAAALAVTWLEPLWAALAGLGFVGLIAAAPALSAAWPTAPMFFQGDDRLFAALSTKMSATLLTAWMVGASVDALREAERAARDRAADAERAQALARRALEAKARFLATMSHELRTPLNAILGYAGLLREDDGDDASDLDRIEHSGRTLLGLVEDLLEMARAEQVELRREPVELRSLVEEQVATLSALRASPPAVVVQAPDDPVVAHGDRGRIRRILGNLLAHAARSASTIEVTVAARGDRVTVTICDRSGAIPPSVLPRLFEPFVGVEVGGTGLGLALAQQLALGLGGRIDAATTDGGSTFTVDLPAMP
ncbi:MAG: HAMP domain-containing sensor histidine kinase [Myxococcota bacterium]